jgi:hypothetical protein
MKFQPRIKGIKRMPSFSSLHPELKKIILSDARRFKCSPSFVMATALAEFFKFRAQPKYWD